MNSKPGSFEMPKRLTGIFNIFMGIGAAGLLAGLAMAAAGMVPAQRIMLPALLAGYYLLTIALGGAVFVALQYVGSAGWGVAIRRVPESMGAALPAAAGVFIVILVAGVKFMYPWSEGIEGGETMWFKRMWLDAPFFLGRAAVYLVIWTVFSYFIAKNSRAQDADGSVSHTQRNSVLSAVFLVLFGLSFWLASFDWIMSLEPMWFSTIFGIYNFAGMILTAVAATTFILIWLNRLGILRGIPTEEHLHTLGKFMLGFACFWAYIWFSQYMLTWYANISEETVYYTMRQHGLWNTVFYLNPLLNWLLPFLVLMPRSAKRSPDFIIKGAMLILVGRWVDIYQMVYPHAYTSRPVFSVWEVALTLGALGLFCSLFFRALSSANTVPVKDPYLAESLPAAH